MLHYRRSQTLPSPVLVAYPDLSQPRLFTTGKQKGSGNSPLSFTECRFCYSSTFLGLLRLQSSKQKIEIFLSFSLSPDDPEFGDRPSHVHNVLISTMTHLSFVRDIHLIHLLPRRGQAGDLGACLIRQECATGHNLSYTVR